MANNVKFNPVYIDGMPYAVRLLTGGSKEGDYNEWDRMLSDLGANNDLLHFNRMSSWCQDSVENEPAYRATRGTRSPEFWSCSRDWLLSMNVGFRPVLVPLDFNTLEPCDRFPSIPDGTVLKMGTLQMDGKLLTNPQYPTCVGDIPNYNPGAQLCIGDSSLDSTKHISWVKWGSLLVSDRNILKNIAWHDLNRHGFVYGNEAHSPDKHHSTLASKIAAAEGKTADRDPTKVSSINKAVANVHEALDKAIELVDEYEATGNKVHPSISNRLMTSKLILTEVMNDLEIQSPAKGHDPEL